MDWMTNEGREGFPPPTKMKSKIVLPLAAGLGLLVSGSVYALPIITQVVETGGDGPPTAKFTGETFTGPNLGTYTVPLFGEDVKAFADRIHEWNGATPSLPIPDYLRGGEYIMIRNDNRDNSGLRLDIALSRTAYVYFLVDNRIPDNVNNTPPNLANHMTWLLANGWTPVRNGHNRTGNLDWPDEIGVDEGTDGLGAGPGVSINQYASIYVKIEPAGTFSAFRADNATRNMYGVVVKAIEPPPSPQNLVARTGDGTVTLNWSPSPGAVSYAVKRSATSGGPYSTIATPATTSHMDTGLVNDTTYYYVVAAVNAGGESAPSSETVGEPRAAPADLEAVGGHGQVRLMWSSFPGAAAYIVKRSTASDGLFVTIATKVAKTTYLDVSVSSGQTYYYMVVAQLIAGGESGHSRQASATTAPGAPGLTASIVATTVIGLSWTDAGPVVTAFAIERSIDGFHFAPLAAVAASERGYLDSGLDLNTTYFYRVRAMNDTGPSESSVTTGQTTPRSGWNVNFATVAAPHFPGYVQDGGELFGERSNGLFYGWDNSILEWARFHENDASPDLRYDTLNHLQRQPAFSRVWQIAVPNGSYRVRLVAGDPGFFDSVFHFEVEGVLTPAETPTADRRWSEFDMIVRVEDGLLTVTSGPSAVNNKIAFIDIYPADALPAPLILIAWGHRESVFALSFGTESGSHYVVEYKNDLSHATWTELVNVPGDGSVKLIADPGASGQTRFYRVRVH
jgi:hypothetical protein